MPVLPSIDLPQRLRHSTSICFQNMQPKHKHIVHFPCLHCRQHTTLNDLRHCAGIHFGQVPLSPEHVGCLPAQRCCQQTALSALRHCAGTSHCATETRSDMPSGKWIYFLIIDCVVWCAGAMPVVKEATEAVRRVHVVCGDTQHPCRRELHGHHLLSYAAPQGAH